MDDDDDETYEVEQHEPLLLNLNMAKRNMWIVSERIAHKNGLN